MPAAYGSGGFEARAVVAVVSAVRAEARGERQVALGLAQPARLLQRAAEAEVREVVHRIALDHCRELLARLRVAAAVEVRATERLADRALVRLELARLLKRNLCGVEVPRLEESGAALEEVVHVLGPLLGRALRLAH